MSIYVGTQIVPAPGQAPSLLGEAERYNKLIEKLGGKVIGNWQITLGEGQGSFAVLTSWPNLAAWQKATEQSQTDPDFMQFLADVGPRVAALNSAVYTPTPNSPMQ